MGALRKIAVALAIAAIGINPEFAAGQDAESAIYAAARDCSGLRAYLKAYPSGRFRADAEARMARDCAPAAPRTLPAPAVVKTPPTDPCIRSRADWPQVAGSSNLEVLRAFVRATPQDCEVQRAQAFARISELETSAREAEARAAAERTAQAQRQAAEAAAARQAEENRLLAERQAIEQQQALLNRSWSAIAKSEWSTGFLSDFIHWGGVTGQSSPEAAEAAAVMACQTKKDATGCAVWGNAYNMGCAALAYVEDAFTGGRWGMGTGDTDEIARTKAIQVCKQDGCEVRVAICATPG